MSQSNDNSFGSLHNWEEKTDIQEDLETRENYSGKGKEF